jgi:hypothetical protein
MQQLQQHRLKSTASIKLRDLLESARAHSPRSLRALTFASLCGIQGGTASMKGGQSDAGIFSEQRVNFFFEVREREKERERARDARTPLLHAAR